MSYDLAVWSGPRPVDDGRAAQEFERRHAGARREAPASAAITAFVADILARHPEGGPDDDDSPWAAGPLISEASGDFIYFAMTVSGVGRAYEDAVRTARRHGLVCFDPQTGQLH